MRCICQAASRTTHCDTFLRTNVARFCAHTNFAKTFFRPVLPMTYVIPCLSRRHVFAQKRVAPRVVQRSPCCPTRAASSRRPAKEVTCGVATPGFLNRVSEPRRVAPRPESKRATGQRRRVSTVCELPRRSHRLLFRAIAAERSAWCVLRDAFMRQTGCVRCSADADARTCPDACVRPGSARQTLLAACGMRLESYVCVGFARA